MSIRSSADYGVYFDNRRQVFYLKEGRTKRIANREEAEERFVEIKKRIMDLLKYADSGELDKIEQVDLYRHVKEKILSLYYPQQFLSVFSESHIDHFLEKSGMLDADTKNLSPIKKKLLLMEFKNKDEFMKNWSPFKFMHFLYEVFPPLNGDESRVWLEKTIVSGRPDREQGSYALGKALWSPQRDKRGADIYRNMRLVERGDLVLHLIDNKAIAGISRVTREYDPDFKCLSGTEWDDGSGNVLGYLVELEAFIHFESAILREDLLNEKYREKLVSILRQRRNVFYNRNLNLRQGAYLTRVPNELVSIIRQLYREKNRAELPYIIESTGYPSLIHVEKAIQEMGKKRIERDELLEKVEQIMSEENIELKNDWKNMTWQNIKKWAERVMS